MYLLKNSLEQFEGTYPLSSFERGHLNYDILQARRQRFDSYAFRTESQVQKITDHMDMCKMVVITGETKRGEDSDISQQGSIAGLRYQQISLPFIGSGPCLMISHADVRLLQKLIVFSTLRTSKCAYS